MERTWQDNADEFAELDQGDGWPFAVLVACSVEKGAGEGGRHDHRNDRYGDKTSASVFAERAGTSAPRVLRFLEAWNMIAQGESDMKPSAGLTPGDVFTAWHPDVPWKEIYKVPADKPSGGRPRDSKPKDAVAIVRKHGPAAVLDEMEPEETEQLRKELEARVRPIGGEEFLQMEQRAKEAPMPQTPLDWSRARAILSEAAGKIGEAMPYLADHTFASDELDLLEEIFTEITEKIQQARTALRPSANWDEELKGMSE